jgi:hypothetical protein
MNDQFLHDLRRAPAPAFAKELRASLAESEERHARQPYLPRVRRWLPLAASVVIVAAAFTFPTVRAGAQAFLDLFRITSVVGVSFEEQSLRTLANSGLDFPSLLGGPVELESSATGPVFVSTTADASELAGIDVLQPAWRPVGLELDFVQVMAEETARFEADTGNIELILDVLGIDDLTVPQALDGQSVMLHIPPIVQLGYVQGDAARVSFLQARSPEVTMPAGIELPVLAEIALRIVGLEREEAFNLAWTIDWRSTLIVPVPAGEADFREVNVAGQQGLAVIPRHDSNRVLLWGNGERVFALTGNVALDELLEMAQTAQ